LQYLITWKGFPEEESTWEPIAHLDNSMELVEELYQANPAKPDKGALENVLRDVA
jgi:hypothetical protein